MSDHSEHHHEQERGSFWRSRAFLVFAGFAAIALALLWKEHQAHILGVIPYLFLLACPLMHLFMHGGHGHRSHHNDHGNAATRASGRRPEEVQ